MIFIKELLKGKKNFAKKIELLKNKKPMELTIGERLTLLRVENGYTNQEKFGSLFSLSKSAINNYENDSAKPDYDTIKLISEHFNVSYDYLFGVSNSKQRKNHDLVNKLGLSENAVNQLIKFGKSNQDAEIVNYLLQSELTPTLVNLIKLYVDATLLSLEQISSKTPEKLTSADFYLNGFSNEESIKYAIIHCFTDIIEYAPSVSESR